MCLTQAPDAFPPQPITTFQITTVQSSSSALHKLRTGCNISMSSYKH